MAEKKRDIIDIIAREGGPASLAPDPNNVIVNIAALRQMSDTVDMAEVFTALGDKVMRGGVVVLTDESTTGQAVSVEFERKVTFGNDDD